MKTETILVPFDFSDASREALRLAKAIAPSFDAQVVLGHVDVMPIVLYPEMAPIPMPAPEVTEAAHRALAEVAMANGQLPVLTRLGDPGEQILAMVEETKPRLVCMGTH